MKTLLAFLLFSLNLLADDFQFKKTSQKLPAIGFEFTPFHDMEVITPSVMRARFYTTDPDSYGKTKRFEIFPKKELWGRNQTLLKLTNNSLTLTLYQVKSPLPNKETLPHYYGKYIRPDEFKAYSKKKFSWKVKNLRSWASEITQIDITKLSNNYLGKSFRYTCRKATTATPDKDYIFMMYPKKGKEPRVLIKVEFANDSLNSKKRTRLVKNFLKKCRFKKSNGNGSSSKFSNNKTRKKGEKSLKYQATVDTVRNSINGKEGWWFTETENFVIKSNIPRKKRRDAINLQKKLEAFRELFTRFMPPSRALDRVSVVTILKNRTDFLDYLKGTGVPEWAGGVWMGSRGELVLYLYDSAWAAQWAKDATIRTLGHEAWHQYLFCLTDAQTAPVWFNEGHAGFVETVKISSSGKTMKILEPESDLRRVINGIKNDSYNLENFVNWEHRKFYDNKDTGYPLSCCITYFLQKAGHLFPKQKYSDVCPRLMSQLMERKGWQEANNYAWEGIDFKQFQKDFKKFWASKSFRTRARKFKVVAKRKK